MLVINEIDAVPKLYYNALSFLLYLFKTYIMKKLIYLFLTVLIVGCSSEDGGNDNNSKSIRKYVGF